MRKKGLFSPSVAQLLLIITVIAGVVAAYTFFFNPSIDMSSINASIDVLDAETAQPIAGANIFLDGQLVGRTVDTGRAILKNVTKVPHKVTIKVPEIGEKDFGELLINQSNLFYVDMPNPSFITAVRIEGRTLPGGLPNLLKEANYVHVELANKGNANSMNTYAVVLLYEVHPNEIVLIDSDILQFGSVKAGTAPIEIVTRDLRNTLFVEESAVVLIFDSHRYMPEQDPGRVDASRGYVNDWLAKAKNTCGDDCARWVGIFVGQTIKSIAT